ncbi:polysaccharide pyruvyl transferase family protein [Elioraea rosea]|uniref:polysaccharide pyruvyl transferase family protein n=1 Tax=Elioraea rosea TaxID=2492390 RepID=UPI0011837059|nr:polysaccharide pyruvyl transferase family protein [Elioraea rosea]
MADRGNATAAAPTQDGNTAVGAAGDHAVLRARMGELSSALDAILPALGPARDIVYLDIPDHENVGDRLIHAGAERFFRRNGVKVRYRCTVDSYREDELRAALRPDTVIALHGGGNFGTIWPRYQRFREAILRTFPDRRIVVLPQSIQFDDDASLAKSSAIFRAHRDVTLCVRDQPSEAVARAHFTDKVMLVPDMAHALWGHLKASCQATRTKPVHLMRRDKESTLDGATTIGTDWLTFLDDTDRRRRHFLKHQEWRLERWRRRLPFLPIPGPWVAIALDGHLLVRKGVRLFSPHHEIHTDRLHAILLACLLERRVSYIDNSYGKLSRYVEAWLPNVPTIRRVEPTLIAPAAGTPG